MAGRREWDSYPEDEDLGYDPYNPYGEDVDGYEDDYADGYEDDYADGYEDDDPEAGEYADDHIYGVRDALRYAGDHTWSLALLLILLPPLGIALMWIRRRFRRRGRIVVTALALAWLALLAFLLVVRPILARRAPVEDTQAEADLTDDLSQLEPVVVPDDQLLSGVNVYVSTNSSFYHQKPDCRAFAQSDTVSMEDRTISLSKGLMACPYCLGADYSDSLFDLKLVSASTEDQSGTMVYCNNGTDDFHVDPNCSKLGSGRAVTLLDALLMGKVECETCCSEASRKVFCTKDGRYYHYEAECSGMRDASLVKLPEAMVLGKSPCPVCIKDTSGATMNTGNSEDSTYYVYATVNGTFYHIKENCSGMKNATKVSLKQMLAARRPACPVCCPNAEMTVYGERGNPYYHSTYSCSNMANPSAGTLAEALSNGLTQCPVCWVSAADAQAAEAGS